MPELLHVRLSDARACHGCGDRLGKRKILRRGSWIFIVLAVTAFTVARGIDLQQEKVWRFHRDEERQAQVEVAREFVSAWLVGANEAVATYVGDRGQFQTDLAKLRNRYPTLLPATKVVGDIRVSEENERHHYQEKGKDAISHTRLGQADKTTLNRASCVPPQLPSGTFRSMVDGVKIRYGSWALKSFEVEAEFTNGDAHYTLYAEVCLDDRSPGSISARLRPSVCCLTIDKIVGVEGVVSPKE